MPAAILTTLLFALTAVFATQAAGVLGGSRANFGRLLVAVVLLGLWAHLFGGGLGGGVFPVLLLAGAFGFGFGGLCMFQAFPRIGSTLSLLVVECAAAITTAGFAWVFLGASLSGLQIIFALLSIGGVLLGLAPYRLPNVPRATLLAGAAFAAIASIGQGVSWTITKHAFNTVAEAGNSLGPLTAAYQRMIGGFLVAVLAVGCVRLLGRGGSISGGRWMHASGWIFANALAGPVLGVSCMLWAIRSVGNPGLVQAVVATATLVSVPFARKLEARELRLNYFIGAGFSIIGTAGLVLNP